jgi:hypothetical protein
MLSACRSCVHRWSGAEIRRLQRCARGAFVGSTSQTAIQFPTLRQAVHLDFSIPFGMCHPGQPTNSSRQRCGEFLLQMVTPQPLAFQTTGGGIALLPRPPPYRCIFLVTCPAPLVPSPVKCSRELSAVPELRATGANNAKIEGSAPKALLLRSQNGELRQRRSSP